jgi:glycosyltransferase involved in cell wall biosynthesis
MKVLVVQSRPYQSFAGGDGAYIDAMVRHLTHRGVEVTGITSGATKGRPRLLLRLAYPTPPGARWWFRQTLSLGERHLAIGPQLVRDVIGFLQERRHPTGISPFILPPDRGERAWISRMLERERPDAVILTFEAAGAVDEVRRLGVPCLALSGFLPMRNYDLSAAPAPLTGAEIQPTEDFLQALRRADRVGFSSRDDCNYAGDRLHLSRPLYVGMGFSRREVRSRSDAPVVLFVGNRTEPNRLALDWFCGKVWPAIRARAPDARFRIVGRVAQYFASVPAEGIECVGEVADLSAAYCGARLVVAPLLTGSPGVKTKVAEAISYGCPLVATSLGVDGGSRDQIDAAGFITDDPDQFARHAADLLLDDQLCADKRRGTERVFDLLFSREAAYGELDQFLAEVAAARAGAPDAPAIA